MAVVASAGALHAAIQSQRDAINLAMMKFFRDLGRYKALKRRFTGNHDNDDDDNGITSKGLLAFMARDTDPLADLLALDADQEDELNLPTFSRQELWRLGNHESDDGTLLLGILGRVYDVTDGGDKYYGPGATYGDFAGKDVTYALATGCKSQACIDTDWTTLEKPIVTQNDDTSGTEKKPSPNKSSAVFTDKQLVEAKKWLSFFHLHDKYALVGKLEGESFEALIQQLLALEEEEDETRAKDDATTATETENASPSPPEDTTAPSAI